MLVTHSSSCVADVQVWVPWSPRSHLRSKEKMLCRLASSLLLTRVLSVVSRVSPLQFLAFCWRFLCLKLLASIVIKCFLVFLCTKRPGSALWRVPKCSQASFWPELWSVLPKKERGSSCGGEARLESCKVTSTAVERWKSGWTSAFMRWRSFEIHSALLWGRSQGHRQCCYPGWDQNKPSPAGASLWINSTYNKFFIRNVYYVICLQTGSHT